MMRIDNMKYGVISYQNHQNHINATNKPKKSPSSADVNISSVGREISQAKMTEQAQRQKRVQELKQLISEGNYQIESNKVAEKLMGFWNNNSK